MPYEENPASIKYHVKRYILQHRQHFAGKVAIDTPAGSGSTSQILLRAGATVHPFDLFPEYFKVEGLTCERANIAQGLPVADGFADLVFCQEGIEHFSDQYRALLEFSRVIKRGGALFITTPNYSSLRARLSYFLFETEYLLKTMPMNEVDSIWNADEARTDEIYLGHLFLLGIQKLRLLAKLAGFQIREIIPTSSSSTSLVLLPLTYPLILLTNWWTLRNQIRRDRTIAGSSRAEVYREQMELNKDVRLLIDRHLFIRFEKTLEPEMVRKHLQPRHQTFDMVT